ncbi:MAG: TIGR00266 family protein [Saprospiraceae bacterium]|nr:TIGR00266 family protein [Saprospiraceae bacterium]MBK8451346.1 TIGR00266 family protein [Saprospiraceae bacterium]MBK8483304.1 TIGR00266 family protein [Saprospiraceae bacterium]MBK9220816.1 TIGR00266 family protein [Saprospiraceae bacterium]MBK9722339.1 TIGR00266 family protein [Saprospiraceae bacterium]
MASNHEIDYRIFGEEMQYVEVELDPGETAIAEAGSFLMMEDGIRMATIFGDGTQQETGFMGKVFSAGKRLLTGESLFMTTFTNEGGGKARVSFASPYAGKIIPLDLSLLDGKVIAQKDSFLCAAMGVSIGIELQRKLGTGIFGGEGFIMQKLEGDGMAFVHAGGFVKELNLGVGETLRIDTGCVVAYTNRVDFDIEFIKGIKNMVFGGEGLFYAVLRGPGKVWIQSLPISRLAARIMQYGGMRRKEEGSILGGLGNILDGN